MTEVIGQDNKFGVVLEQLQSVNGLAASIGAQNARLELSEQIADEDFKTLAVASLEREQAETAEALVAASATIPYQDIYNYNQALEQAQTNILADAETRAHQAELQLRSMAELVLKVAPDTQNLAQALLASKIDQARAKIAQDIQSSLGTVEAAQAAHLVIYVEAAKEWPIPRVAPMFSVIRTTGDLPGYLPEAAAATTTAEAATHEPNEITAIQLAPPESAAAAVPAEKAVIAGQSSEKVMLNPHERAVLAYAEQTGSFRLEDLKKDVASIGEMSTEDYKTFKELFKTSRERIVDYLAGQGTTAEWVVSGKTRGTRYKLDKYTSNQGDPAAFKIGLNGIETIAAAATLEVAVPAPAAVAHHEQAAQVHTGGLEAMAPQALAEVPLIQSILSKIVDKLWSQPNGTLKRSLICKEITEIPEIDEETASTIFKRLLDAGLLHDVGHEKGVRQYSTVPSEKVEESASKVVIESLQTPTEIEEQDNQLKPEVVEKVARAVYAALAELTHHTQGISLKTLVRDTILADINEVTARQVIRRLHAAGYLLIIRNRQTGSQNSKRLEVATVKFVDAQMRKEFKENPNAVIRRMMADINKDTSRDGVINGLERGFTNDD